MRTGQRVLLGWVIAALAVAMIIIMMRDSVMAANAILTKTSLTGLAVLILPSALMMLATGWSFSLLVLSTNRTARSYISVIAIFLTAQIIKYLPGRIWGFLYQIKRLSEQAHTSMVLVASANHLILTSLISMLFLGLAFKVPGAWLLLLLGTFLGLLWTQRGGTAAYLVRINRIPESTRARLPAKAILGIAVSLTLEWLFYLSVWSGLFLLLKLPPKPEMIISIAALYAGAWIVGSLTSLIPSGLGIREGGFIMAGMGLGITEPNLIALAILARMVFALGEVLTGAFAALYLQSKGNLL